MKPEYQLLMTVGGFIITVYGFYNLLRAKSIEQATKINSLELRLGFLEQQTKDHTRRLDDHDKQNQALVAMTEQIKNLTEDVKELKIMIEKKGSEIMNKFAKKLAIKVIKTMAQAALGVIGSSALLTEVNWVVVASTVGLAGLTCILMNLSELKED